MMKGRPFAQSHADFLVFFFLFWTMDHCTRLVPIATTIDGTSACARSGQRPEVEFSFQFSTYHVQSALLRVGIAIAVRQVKPAPLWKKERNFQQILVVRVRKNAWRRSGVFKKSPKTSSKPKAPELEHLAPNFSKARETEKLFEKDITLERNEIISSFERKSSFDSLA